MTKGYELLFLYIVVVMFITSLGNSESRNYDWKIGKKSTFIKIVETIVQPLLICIIIAAAVPEDDPFIISSLFIYCAYHIGRLSERNDEE